MISFVNSEVDNFTNIFYVSGEPIGAIALLSCLAWGLGYFGMPHIIIRYMAIKKPEEVKIARRVGTAWIIVALTGAALIGMVGCADDFHIHRNREQRYKQDWMIWWA